MRSEKKNVLGTIFALIMFIASSVGNVALFAIPLASIAPAVEAANGLGEVTFMSIDGFESSIDKGVITTNAEKDIVFKIHNNDDESDGIDCIDEIIITFPKKWQGQINTATSTVTNMGTVILTNKNNSNNLDPTGTPGPFSGVDDNYVSLRIQPDFGSDGVMLCPSGTTQITLKGLKAPANPEDSQIMIMTSDENSNEPSTSYVRQPISILPLIKVTKAVEVKVEYIDFISTPAAGGGADYKWTAQAKGAWGRLTELYLNASPGTTIDVYLDKNGDGILQTGTDYKIASGKPVGTGTTTVSLDKYAGVDIVGIPTNLVDEGFVKDSEQGGSPVTYFIDAAGTPTLNFLGYADEDADGSIDTSYTGTGFFNPPKEGTVLNVESAMQRKIHVQLVKVDPTNSSRLLDVEEGGIPIYFSTIFSSSSFADASPMVTSSSPPFPLYAVGETDIRLNPGTKSGNADVKVCFPDPECTHEDVAIAPGAAYRCAITQGLDTTVEAGSTETIEATIYDQYGNVISNNPSRPLVTFNLMSAPGLDASIDSGDGSNKELANLGIADADLQTSATVGDNVVQVTAGNLACGTTTIKGVLGQAGAIDCEVTAIDANPEIAGAQLTANQCFNVLINVKDANGNPLPKWESLVELSLFGTDKTFGATNLREKKYSDGDKKLQGKLLPNDPAYATVEVCGCDALGELSLVCKTDTLNDDQENLDVINSQPTCIDVKVESRGGNCVQVGQEGTELECPRHQTEKECEDPKFEGCAWVENACDDTMQLHSSILDSCGNKVVDQECSEGGFASSCILLDADDQCAVLSTEKTCVDLGNTGQAPLVDLDISQCACGDVTITAIDTGDCCNSVYHGELPQCSPLVINKEGPATHIDMSVYPKAENQDNFWVSEKGVLDLELKDACGQTVTCEDTTVDVELTGEDCVKTEIQVDSPFTAVGQERCSFSDKPVHKVVFENCAEASKEAGNKEWTDLPEKDDIVVDKIAFDYNGPTTNVKACIYEETEAQVGFQASGSNADLLWKCADLSSVPTVPNNDADTSGNTAGDEIHDGDSTPKNGVGDTYIMELDDRISKFNGMNEYDNQRLGGSVIEPGKTKDFYIVLSSNGAVTCGLFDADYLYFEDYNSPDITGFLYGGHVIDTLEDSEQYTRRNDDYTGSDPYPSTKPKTASYGFGDTILHDLQFSAGKAYMYFRDLVAEKVNIFVDASLPVNFIGYPPAEEDNQAEVTFLAQPATQVVALNHGDMDGDSIICDGAGFEPSILFDSDPREVETFNMAGDVDAVITKTDSEYNNYVEFKIDITSTGPHYGVGLVIATSLSEPDFQVYFAEFGNNQWHYQNYGANLGGQYCGWETGLDTTILPNGIVATGNQNGQNFAIKIPKSMLGDKGDAYYFAIQARTNLLGKFPSTWEPWCGPISGYQETTNGKEKNVRECRPAKACDGEGYDINLQVTDGFQNQVGLETEIQLDACLEFPHFIYLGDDATVSIDLWQYMGLHDLSSEPRDVCFDMAKFKEVVKKILDEKVGPDNEFIKSFVGSEEFDDFVSSIFDNKKVIFEDENGNDITQKDAAGHLIVKTDSDGKAIIRVESNDSSMFQIKSFDTSFRIFTTPHALDADYFDVAFAPGAPSQWDIMAVPSTGIPADGEQEAKLLIRKLDACGNPVALESYNNEQVKVSVDGSALISRDFSGNNNYDNEVTGDLSQWTCKFLFPWFEDCSLEVLNDVIEDVVVKVEDAQCDGGSSTGFCTAAPQCDPGENPACLGCGTLDEQTCKDSDDETCLWIEEPICAQDSDATMISFVGAPTKLKITEIKHSDLIPADGWKEWEAEHKFDLPKDACTDEEIRECVLGGEPEICFKNCVQYGNSGAWVTVEVQDKFGQRVTGYLGDGFKGDPGDKKGYPDNVFEKVCVALDDNNAFIADATFGWIDLEKVSKHPRVYCGDLAYGRGSFKVSYKMLTKRLTGDGIERNQPLDPRETEKVIVSVFDVCDRKAFEDNGFDINSFSWKEKRWDDLCNAQEYNENNLPDSETASRLDPDSNKIIFVSPADRWDIITDKYVVAADGEDYATLTINTENAYMDVRTSLDATVQSSLLGSKLESDAITPGCYVEGTFDPVNPTSINVMTEACSGGKANLKLSSTKPGTARITVTGNNFGCVEFEVSESDGDDIYAVPKCERFGVIPMTPKVIEVEFKQAFQNKLELKEGWNFFSVPVELDASMDTWVELKTGLGCVASQMWDEEIVLTPLVTNKWVSPIPSGTQIIPLEGYWCYVDSDRIVEITPLTITGVYLPPTKLIYTGWNDVGLSSNVERRTEHALISIDKIYTQVLDWVEGLQRYFGVANTGELGGGDVPGTTGTDSMEAGQGYFVWSEENGQIAGLS